MNKACFFLIIAIVPGLCACNNNASLFEQVKSDHSGIHFNNRITETDSVNPMDVVNIYNGGGAGIGDFNNDGLQDIYFTGNMVAGKLYLNKGDFKFVDITEKAGVAGMGRWARGIAVVDINNDGLMDMYLCNTILKDSLQRRNILYVNQGADKEGIPHFKNMAAEYGLAINLQSTMASFFDYDNDGDLDMFLTVNEASNGNNTSVFLQRNNKNLAPSRHRLYRNDGDSSAAHPVFKDVSDEAGMLLEGYGHAATICDINNDGWKDIYVSDDFLSNNILYINNHNGTFTDRAKEYFKHTSYNAMGQDVVDINNDGLPDVVELDMNPEDNFRKKMMLASNSYLTYQNFDTYKYQYQYVRNTLQLNQGPSLKENDSVGPPAFSEMAFVSGIAQTDWSWSPLVADFDNDSYRDLVITNGFPRDVSDHDFMAYRQRTRGLVGTKDLMEQIPQVKLHNYAYRNNGDATFSDETKQWGLTVPTFSNGIATADFDNDGALDMVISNINDEALLYRNTSRSKDKPNNHFLQVNFKGNNRNINGLGALVKVYYDHGKQQVFDNNPYRGYLSSMQAGAHFGLGATAVLDSVVVTWFDGKKQTIKNVPANQVLTVNIKDATDAGTLQQALLAANTLFKEITTAAGIQYRHYDPDFIDFNIQTTLPHKLSAYNPALAVADLDGNGLDDLLAGGNPSFHPQMLLQQTDGKFTQKDFLNAAEPSFPTDEGILIFDANGDGKNDVYIASGGFKAKAGLNSYQDRLYMNDGKGNFTRDSLALPVNYTSKFCVRAMDYNNDGKLDLLVAGRVEPGKYPTPVSSFIYRNDSENGKTKFTDVTATVAPDLQNIGMVCDALFTDFNNDKQIDLILAGEWMPVTFLKNTGGKFTNVTDASGISAQAGWWNSIAAGDFRHTGRIDYIVGNTGLNTLYHASEKFPVYMTAKDFDHNGSYVPVPSLFLPATDGTMKEFPAFGRDDIVERVPTLKKRFNDYKKFANATVQDIITPEMMKDAQRLKATMLQSCYLRNEGNGKFTLIPLPQQAQLSAVNGMLTGDFDADGNLDVLINANDFGNEVSIGRLDAMNGLLLKGDGKGGFTPLSILQSGIYIPGDGKALVNLMASNGKYQVAASQNRNVLKLFELKTKKEFIKLNNDDVFAVLHYKNGTAEKQEFYYGAGFLSQSARYCIVNPGIASVEITNTKGVSRTVTMQY